jgi:anti-anti-sigma factor
MAKIDVSRKDSSVIIRISGQFDYLCHREFRDAYRYEPENTRFEIDLYRTEALDSAALGMLLLLRDHAGREHCDIVIRGCAPNIKRILEIASFDKLFKIV